MPYVGVAPSSGLFKKLDSITVVNGQAAYTMQYNSSNFKPGTASQLIVSVNGVIQAPEDAFTIDGSTITFTENLVTGDVIDFIVALGEVGNTVTPVDGSVTASKLASSIDMQNITLKGGTTDALTIDSNGNVAIKKAKRYLFRAYNNGTTDTITHNTGTVVSFDAEDFDLEGVYDTSNNRYTPTQAGYYHIEVSVAVSDAAGDNLYLAAYVRKNGTIELRDIKNITVGSGAEYFLNVSGVVYLDGDDYVDVQFYHYNYTDSGSVKISTGRSETYFSGYLIQEA